MKLTTIQKFGGISLILGASLFSIYSISFPLLLPISEVQRDLTLLIKNPNWMWLGITAILGIIMMVFGFMAVYSRLYEESGIIGLLGFIFIELAYILQACKVTWEICLDPVIASHESAAVLLRDGIIQHDFNVLVFKYVSSAAILLGIIFFSLTLVRSKEFSKIAGIFIFTGAFSYAIGPVLLMRIAGIFILSIGCMILGVQLIRGKNI